MTQISSNLKVDTHLEIHLHSRSRQTKLTLLTGKRTKKILEIALMLHFIYGCMPQQQMYVNTGYKRWLAGPKGL